MEIDYIITEVAPQPGILDGEIHLSIREFHVKKVSLNSLSIEFDKNISVYRDGGWKITHLSGSTYQVEKKDDLRVIHNVREARYV